MPDISKINALAIGSVSKVDGLAKASILDINGLTVTPFTGLLDTYTGAAAAYSVRRLSSSFTGACMRVRRASDNVEADVGFDSNNELGLTSPISNTSDAQSYTDLADFVDHTGTPDNGFCRWWYDQSGNAVDAGQSSATPQPKIYDSSTGLIEEGSVGNEKPAIQWDTSKLGEFVLALNQAFTSVAVFKLTGTPSFSPIFGSRDGTGVQGSFVARTTNWWMQSGSLVDTGQAHDNTQHLFYSVWDGASSEFAQDGGTITTLNPGTNDWTNLAIGSRGTDAASIGCDGLWQELIFWNTDQTGNGNRNGIETDINGYFSIF